MTMMMAMVIEPMMVVMVVMMVVVVVVVGSRGINSAATDPKPQKTIVTFLQPSLHYSCPYDPLHTPTTTATRQVPEMVRFTFVVGGGSKVRQKYDPNLQKYMSKSLQDIGFNLDNTACCAVECAETYKTQHDTDKNLKVRACGGGGVGRGRLEALTLMP